MAEIQCVYLATRYDKKIVPDYRPYRTLTRQEVLALQPGDEVWWLSGLGRLARVKVNGKTKTWKRQPERAEILLKYGMYECFHVSLYEALAFMFKEVDGPVLRPWVRNEGKAPPVMGRVDIRLNEDEQGYPGVPVERFNVEPDKWDWQKQSTCGITHWRPSER